MANEAETIAMKITDVAQQLPQHVDLMKRKAPKLSSVEWQLIYNDMILASRQMAAAADRIERLDSALRIRIWNEARGRGVTQDAALALVKESMSGLNPHSGPS